MATITAGTRFQIKSATTAATTAKVIAMSLMALVPPQNVRRAWADCHNRFHLGQRSGFKARALGRGDQGLSLPKFSKDLHPFYCPGFFLPPVRKHLAADRSGIRKGSSE